MIVLNKECNRCSVSVLGGKQVNVQTWLCCYTFASCKARERERQVFNKCNSRHIQETEPNRYSRVLERLPLRLSTRHAKVTVLSGRIGLCVQSGGKQETQKVESWLSYCEIKRNKEIQNWGRGGKEEIKKEIQRKNVK
jgi:hypothetical protein